MTDKLCVVASRFNALAVESLLKGCESVLSEHGVLWDLVWVPGAFELPQVANIAARSGKYVAVICLGCVIRGDTPHFDFVASEAARGIMDVSLRHGLPVMFGVLTTDTIEQALSRSGLKGGNKGREAALAALETVRAVRAIDQHQAG